MTAKRAQYDRHSLVVTTSRAGGLPVHYLMCRYGAVARTWTPGHVEVVLWRPRNLHATFQGIVAHTLSGWTATDPQGRQVATTADYLDAEAALLPLRTRRRSYGAYDWPWHILRELEVRRAPAPKPECDICGHELQGGECVRPDLHWDVVDGKFYTARELADLTR